MDITQGESGSRLQSDEARFRSRSAVAHAEERIDSIPSHRP